MQLSGCRPSNFFFPVEGITSVISIRGSNQAGLDVALHVVFFPAFQFHSQAFLFLDRQSALHGAERNLARLALVHHVALYAQAADFLIVGTQHEILQTRSELLAPVEVHGCLVSGMFSRDGGFGRHTEKQ